MIAVVYPHEAKIYPIGHARSLNPGTQALDAVPRSEWVEGQDRLLERHGYERTGPWFHKQGFPWCEVRRVDG